MALVRDIMPGQLVRVKRGLSDRSRRVTIRVLEVQDADRGIIRGERVINAPDIGEYSKRAQIYILPPNNEVELLEGPAFERVSEPPRGAEAEVDPAIEAESKQFWADLEKARERDRQRQDVLIDKSIFEPPPPRDEGGDDGEGGGNKPNLVFWWEREGVLFVGPMVHHPGNEAQPFMEAGFAAMDAAAEGILKKHYGA